MTTKTLGSLGAVTAALAVLVCVMTVALTMPAALEIAMIVAGVLLLVGAGALIVAAVAKQRKAHP